MNCWDAKQTIAIAVKYPMRSAAIIISSITPPKFGTMLQEQEKSCALSHSRDWGRDGNIPGPASAKHRNRRSGRGSPGNLWRRAKPLQMACVLQCLKLPYWRYG